MFRSVHPAYSIKLKQERGKVCSMGKLTAKCSALTAAINIAELTQFS